MYHIFFIHSSVNAHLGCFQVPSSFKPPHPLRLITPQWKPSLESTQTHTWRVCIKLFPSHVQASILAAALLRWEACVDASASFTEHLCLSLHSQYSVPNLAFKRCLISKWISEGIVTSLGNHIQFFWKQSGNSGKGTSLVVQLLRLWTPNAGGLGSIPGQGTRSHMLQLKLGTAK